MKRMTIGYLTYVTQKNKDNRLLDFYNSLESLKTFKSDQIEFISIDNSSIDEVKNKLKSSDRFSEFFHYKRNHFDVALFYTTAWYARDNNIDYMCFLYDDFIAYDDAFDEVISFMDQNQDVSCVRIPAYDFNQNHLYDADKTPKSINPDSIRHYNSVTNKKLKWEGPFEVGNSTFYKNNWHYTSRPIVWRTSLFNKIIELQGNTSKVLQGFEAWAAPAFEKEKIKTGVLDKGMVKTTPVDHSARGLEIQSNVESVIQISVNDIRIDYQDILKTKDQLQ